MIIIIIINIIHYGAHTGEGEDFRRHDLLRVVMIYARISRGFGAQIEPLAAAAAKLVRYARTTRRLNYTSCTLYVETIG